MLNFNTKQLDLFLADLEQGTAPLIKLTAFASFIKYLTEQHRVEDALAVAKTAVLKYPAEAQCHVWLIEQLICAGQSGAALAHFESQATRLEEEAFLQSLIKYYRASVAKSTPSATKNKLREQLAIHLSLLGEPAIEALIIKACVSLSEEDLLHLLLSGLECCPDSQELYSRLSYQTVEKEQLAFAIQWLDYSLIKQGPKSNLWHVLGHCYTLDDQHKLAAHAYQLAWGNNPEDEAIALFYLNALLQSKNYRRLKQVAFACSELYDRSLDYNFFMAIAELGSHNIKNCLQHIELALDEQPHNKELLLLKSRALIADGRSHLAVSIALEAIHFMEAEEPSDLVILIEETDPYFYYQMLGQAYDSIGNYTAAADAYYEAAGLSPELTMLWVAAYHSLLMAGDVERAHEWREEGEISTSKTEFELLSNNWSAALSCN